MKGERWGGRVEDGLEWMCMSVAVFNEKGRGVLNCCLLICLWSSAQLEEDDEDDDQEGGDEDQDEDYNLESDVRLCMTTMNERRCVNQMNSCYMILLCACKCDHRVISCSGMPLIDLISLQPRWIVQEAFVSIFTDWTLIYSQLEGIGTHLNNNYLLELELKDSPKCNIITLPFMN